MRQPRQACGPFASASRKTGKSHDGSRHHFLAAECSLRHHPLRLLHAARRSVCAGAEHKQPDIPVVRRYCHVCGLRRHLCGTVALRCGRYERGGVRLVAHRRNGLCGGARPTCCAAGVCAAHPPAVACLHDRCRRFFHCLAGGDADAVRRAHHLAAAALWDGTGHLPAQWSPSSRRASLP